MVILKLLLTIVLTILTAMVIVLSTIILLHEFDKNYWWIHITIPIILCAATVYLWLYPWYNFVMI